MTASHSGEEADVPSRQGRCQGEGTTSPPLAKEPVRRRPKHSPFSLHPDLRRTQVHSCTRLEGFELALEQPANDEDDKVASGWTGDPSVCEGR